MPPVPEERPQPEEIPYREIPHQEDDEFPDDWGYRSYPVGSVRDEDFYGWESEETEAAWWQERQRKDDARKKLGGFGFCANRV